MIESVTPTDAEWMCVHTYRLSDAVNRNSDVTRRRINQVLEVSGPLIQV